MWQEWSQWSPCTGGCHVEGIQRRYRQCLAGLGLCIGASMDERKCKGAAETCYCVYSSTTLQLLFADQTYAGVAWVEKDGKPGLTDNTERLAEGDKLQDGVTFRTGCSQCTCGHGMLRCKIKDCGKCGVLWQQNELLTGTRIWWKKNYFDVTWIWIISVIRVEFLFSIRSNFRFHIIKTIPPIMDSCLKFILLKNLFRDCLRKAIVEFCLYVGLCLVPNGFVLIRNPALYVQKMTASGNLGRRGVAVQSAAAAVFNGAVVRFYVPLHLKAVSVNQLAFGRLDHVPV